MYSPAECELYNRWVGVGGRGFTLQSMLALLNVWSMAQKIQHYLNAEAC